MEAAYSSSTKRLLRRQLLQQRLRFFQIARIEALSEPPTNRSQQVVRLLHLAWSRQRRARLIAACSSKLFAFCCCATAMAVRNASSAGTGLRAAAEARILVRYKFVAVVLIERIGMSHCATVVDRFPVLRSNPIGKAADRGKV
jgi:hypothetical protein